MKGRDTFGTMVQVTASCCGLLLLALAVWLFLVDRFEPGTGMHFDGLGRELHHGAGLLGRDRSPGLLWEIVDTAVAIAAFSAIARLYSYGSELKERRTIL
jgi:hypothetical protein